MKIQVSSDTFNEIALALQKEGREINTVVYQIEKSDVLKQPINFQLVLARKDCLLEAVKCNDSSVDNVVDLANDMYKWLISGEIK